MRFDPNLPPHSIEAEQAVLGGLMLAPEAWPLVSDTLSAEDFYRHDHQLIFESIRTLAEKQRPFDAVTIGEWFESRGKLELVGDGTYITELASTTPSAANVVAYAEIVMQYAGRRRLADVGRKAVESARQQDGREFPELLAELTQDIAGLQPAQRGGLRLAGETLYGWYKRWEERYHSGGGLTGLETPWAEFNRVTHGLQPSTAYLIAGRPSMGKSIAALNVAVFSALKGLTVGLFSLEMSIDDCHDRNVASVGHILHEWVTRPRHSGEDSEIYQNRMTPTIRDLKAAPLYIDDTASLNVRQFEARARRMHQRKPLQLLVIDHIHDFDVDPRMARFEYGRILQKGKDLAKEWKIPLVALAQLNRSVTGRTDRRPTLSDLRESGELEQKADVVVLLHREDYYDTPEQQTHLQGVVEMHFAKGRNIRAGERISLQNRFDQMRIDNWDGPLPRKPEAANDDQPRRRTSYGPGRKTYAGAIR
ncbi:replicative DNA helicase [Stenotrophomonas maltophilia]|uniref:replicative DNA helicase n=1 Tax=Stenotrophomonas maltophilia TaxID=40324 RepID=UPI0009B2B4D7|nr:replicative DNA helicase [Stenotrophomonas maltophilia]